MLLYCLVHGKVQYFLESRVWWRAKWAVVPLAWYCMCCAMWQRGGHGATVPQHYWDHPWLGASDLCGLTLLYCTVASWLPRGLNTYWCVWERENVPYLGLCLVGRHLKVALSPSNFFEGGSDGPIHHQAWSDQNSLRGEEQVLGAKMIRTCLMQYLTRFWQQVVGGLPECLVFKKTHQTHRCAYPVWVSLLPLWSYVTSHSILR